MLVLSTPVTTAPAMLPPDSDINKNTSTTTTYNNDDPTNTSTSSTATTTNIIINNYSNNNNIYRKWRVAVQIPRGGAAVVWLPLASTMTAG